MVQRKLVVDIPVPKSALSPVGSTGSQSFSDFSALLQDSENIQIEGTKRFNTKLARKLAKCRMELSAYQQIESVLYQKLMIFHTEIRPFANTERIMAIEGLLLSFNQTIDNAILRVEESIRVFYDELFDDVHSNIVCNFLGRTASSVAPTNHDCVRSSITIINHLSSRTKTNTRGGSLPKIEEANIKSNENDCEHVEDVRDTRKVFAHPSKDAIASNESENDTSANSDNDFVTLTSLNITNEKKCSNRHNIRLDAADKRLVSECKTNGNITRKRKKYTIC